MKKVTVYVLCLVACGSSSHVQRSNRLDPEELFKSNGFTHSLNIEDKVLQDLGGLSDNSDVVKKREIKLSDSGLFYHDGPYVSHSQVQRKAPTYELYGRLPKEPKVYKNDQRYVGKIPTYTRDVGKKI